MASFLKDFFIDGCKLQIGEHNNVLWEGAENDINSLSLSDRKNLYFLGGVDLKTVGRAKDEDVIKKNYIFFDFDIRSKSPDVTDDEIKKYGEVLLNSLESHKIFKDWAHLVFTGNGLHLYFIGKEEIIFDKDVFRAGMKVLMEKIGNYVGLQNELDKACCNIGRISRLPGTINQKTGKKVEVLKSQKNRIDLLGLVRLGEKKKEEEERNKKIEAEQIKEKHEISLDDQDRFHLINNIPIANLVCEWFDWTCDGRNFFKEGDSKPVACFVSENGNYLIHGGTDHIPDVRVGFSPFTFVKVMGKYTNNEVFEWFRAKYLPPEKKEEAKDFSSVRVLQSQDIKKEALLGLDEDNTPFTWGVDDLDLCFPPLERGQYIVVAGETGVGKTAWTLHLALENCKLGLKVLYLSLEMSNKGLMIRYARERAGITFNEWKGKVFSEEKRKLYSKALDEFPETLYFICADDVGYDVELLEELLKREKFDLIVIDNLGFFEAEGESELGKQSNMSRGILELCRKHEEVSIVVVHHYRKGLSTGKPRGLNDLMGSAKLSHDVSYAVQIWRNVEEGGNISKVLIQKSRAWGGYFSKDVAYENGVFMNIFDAKVEMLRANNVNEVFGK